MMTEIYNGTNVKAFAMQHKSNQNEMKKYAATFSIIKSIDMNANTSYDNK